METIVKKLSKIQRFLVARKSQFNKFGKYYYRNAEDILESLKPLDGSNLSNDWIIPTFPSDISSFSGNPYPLKPIAIFTTNLRWELTRVWAPRDS